MMADLPTCPRQHRGGPRLLAQLLAAPGLRGWATGTIIAIVGVCAATVFNAAWLLLKPATFQAFRWERQRLDGYHETIAYGIQATGYGAERVILFDRHYLDGTWYINWLQPPAWPSVHSWDVESREPRDAWKIVVLPATWKVSHVFDVMQVSPGPWRPWFDFEYTIDGVGGGYVPATPWFSVAPFQLVSNWWSPQRCEARWSAIVTDLLIPVAVWSAAYFAHRGLLLRRRSKRGLCWRCAYPVTAAVTGTRCPECGSITASPKPGVEVE